MQFKINDQLWGFFFHYEQQFAIIISNQIIAKKMKVIYSKYNKV